MKIVKLTAENIKRLRVVEITPDGALVEITGKNGSGKSSVLDSIFYALAGGMMPAQPIRRSEKKASIRLDLGELIVTRRFAANGSTLMVEATSGARFPSPQKMLDDLVGAISFDPLAFSRMSPTEQFDMLRQVVKLDVDLDALAAASERDFAERTVLNREAKTLRAQAEGLKIDSSVPVEPINVSLLQEKLRTAINVNDHAAKAKAEVDKIQALIAQSRDDVAEYRRRADRVEQQIAEFERKLAELPPMPDLIDVDEIQQEIQAANQINAQVNQRRLRAQLEGSAVNVEETADKLTAAIAERERQKLDAIKRAAMPIPGLGFGDKMVVYDDLPFDQASSADQLRISVAIAMAMNPKLRVLRVKDGSLLDADSWRMLGELAAGADYQIWIETVQAHGPVSVLMEDGSVARQTAPADASGG